MIKASKIRQLLALLIVVAVLSLAAVIALKSYRSMRSKPVLPSLPKNIDLSLHKINYTEIKDGVKKWELTSESATYDRSGEKALLSAVTLRIFKAHPLGDITVTSDRADYDTRQKDVLLSGNVVAKSSSGMEFRTGHISYISSESMLKTTDRVSYTDGTLRLEGVGMELSTHDKKIRVISQVEATYSGGTGK